MATLLIRNSFSSISDLKTGEFKRLREILSYRDDLKKAAFYGGYSRAHYLLDSKGNFPTGLLPDVLEFMKNEQLLDKLVIQDSRIVPKSVSGTFKLDLGPIKPYPEQIGAAKSVLLNGRAGIVMPTGTGKSLVIALIAHILQVKVLVVVPTLEIKQQLSHSCLNLFKSLSNITIENIDSRSLQDAKGYDCLILDECHHSAAKTYQRLNKTAWKDIYYRAFLTATPFRNEPAEEMLLKGIIGDVTYELTYRDAVSKGYICPVEAYYLDIPKQECDLYTWRQVYDRLVVHNEVRNMIIANLMNELKAAGVATLCLVKEIDHGAILSEMTGIPFVNGQDEESRKYIDDFNRGAIKLIIGTTGVLGEGIDTKPAEFIIIAGLGKAKSAFIQSIGRGVRRHGDKESCKVILFKDTSHKFTTRHFNAQRAILKSEYGVKVEKL